MTEKELIEKIADKLIIYGDEGVFHPKADAEQISSLCKAFYQGEPIINDKNIRKAIDVLKSGTTNPIIISDMVNVLEREYSHMEILIDVQSNHVEELLADKPEE